MTVPVAGDHPGPCPGPPSARAFVGEGRALAELAGFFRQRQALVESLPRGRSWRVMVLPGFLANDFTTSPLRHLLSDLGHDVTGWGAGRNLGLRPGVYEAMEARFRTFARHAQQPVALIGWSLGGLYAIELARRFPDLVGHVFTLGSPVSGHLTANRAWRLYERVAGHRIDSAPIIWQPGAIPPMPLTAIAAMGDGIVHPVAACARPDRLVENVAVPGTHIGLVWNVHVARLISNRLAFPRDFCS